MTIPYQLLDNVGETSTTGGTGPQLLLGARVGMRAFANLAAGVPAYVRYTDKITGDWEISLSDYSASANTLTRRTPDSSSNSGAPVPFVAGHTLQVTLVAPSSILGGNALVNAGFVTVAAGSDAVAIVQGGAVERITLDNLLEGQTIDVATAAGAAADTDKFWVGQGSSTMNAQTFSAMWTWIAGHLPGFKSPVVEITTNTNLDASVHNGRLLVVSTPGLTLTPGVAMGASGAAFCCEVINVSGGNLTLAAGIVTSSGSQTIGNNQTAIIYSTVYSGGTLNYASVSGGAAVAVPGAPTILPAGTISYQSIVVNWSAPTTGGTPTKYFVYYRQTLVGGAYTAIDTGSSSTSYTLTGLLASTPYDIYVAANNVAGTGAPSVGLSPSPTTTASPSIVPGAVTGVAVSSATSSTLSIVWIAPSTGGVVGDYTVGYRLNSVGGAYTTIAHAAAAGATSYTITGLASNTPYDIEVLAVNLIGSGTAGTLANQSTSVATPGTPTSLAAGTATSTTIPLTWTAPGSGGAPTGYTVFYRQNLVGGSYASVATGSTATSYTLSGLASATAYDIYVVATNGLSGPNSALVSPTPSTAAAAPNAPTSLAAGTPTSTTIPLTWTAPGSGSTPTGYRVYYRDHSVGGAYSYVDTGSSATSYTLGSGTALASSTTYDVYVAGTIGAVIGTGSSPASPNPTTAAGVSYLLTIYNPTTDPGWAHGSGGNISQVNINTSSGDGSHTAPGSVMWGWSTSNTVAPTTGLQGTAAFSAGGHNLMVLYANAPATAGTYYAWAIGYSGASGTGSVVATAVSSFPFVIT